MNVLHICAGWQKWNGAANIARMIMGEQKREGHDVQFATWASVRQLRSADEVWIHCGWLPCLWWAAVVCYLTQRRRGAERVLKWMPEACYDPLRLEYHGWKKWLVGPVERFCLRRCSKIVATCEEEKCWIQSYLGKHCPPVEVTDIKRFFKISSEFRVQSLELSAQSATHNSKLHLLYLGRRHLLKGLEYLEEAVKSLEFRVQSSKSNACSGNSQLTTHSLQLELRVVSNAFGEEKEKVWDWCDVLVLPTLSENFGLVVAEALERGKRVITTDGAPVWGDGNDYGGRLIYLEGYRDGSSDKRIRLLKNAIEGLSCQS